MPWQPLRRCQRLAVETQSSLFRKFTRQFSAGLCAAIADLTLQEIGERTSTAVPELIAACTDEVALQLLRHPLPAHELAAAASIALLARYSPEIAALLTEGTRLQLLLTECLRETVACGDDCNRITLDSLEDDFRSDGLAVNVRTVRVCGLVTAIHAAVAQAGLVDNDGVPTNRAAKRARLSSASVLTRADVNVPRYDTLTLLAAGQPLHICGMLMEAVSPLLKDLFSGADAPADGRRGERLVLPVPADVEPEAFHALCCAAVEHTYTGDVQELLAASLLPLWCVAHHLQMATLQAWCAARVADAAAEAGDGALPLVLETLCVALRHKSDTLLRAAARGVLVLHMLELPEVMAHVLRPHEGAAEALADACAALLREALVQKRDAAAAAAAAE